MLATAACFAATTLAAVPAYAEQVQGDMPAPDPDMPKLLDVPLEDLLTLEASSVAKKRQRVSESAAAVYVISQEDIRRSSASTIPDLLRGVPGVEVGRQTNGGYAVSIRGFNSRLANSLLVMVDGRSQFVSTLSGVFWDQLMIPLGDIERIEIVRGPGAALWGANSSNGVINIVTKHSADTGGRAIDVRAGAREQQAAFSLGGTVVEGLHYRAYASVRHDNGLVDASGKDIGKGWIGGAGGARLDWEPNDSDAYTVQGDYAEGHYDTPFRLVSQDLLAPGYIPFQPESRFRTASALARWVHRAGDTLDWSLQGQYNYVDRTEFGGAHLVWQLADLDLGVHWRPNAVHDINLGVGARLLHDKLGGTSYFYFDDPKATDTWLSGYVQDDITVVPGLLRLTIGTKVEKNNFTGFEFQPSARVFVSPARGWSLWGGVSRAVRTPPRFERSARMALTVDLPGSLDNPFPLPLYATLNGVANRGSEKLTAFEAGFRGNLGGNWSLDVAGYYNRYDRLVIMSPRAVTPLFQPPIPFPLGIRVDLDFVGKGKARTWGVEANLGGNVTAWWKTTLAYSHFDFTVADDPLTGQPVNLLFTLQGSPKHQASWRNSFDLGDRIALDAQLRHVSRLARDPIPAYTTADVRLTYRLDNGAEFSLVGNNLLQARHAEFAQTQYPAPLAFVPRSVAAQLRYRF